MSSNQSTHGGVLFAVKSYIESNQIKIELPECCIACQILLKSNPFKSCASTTLRNIVASDTQTKTTLDSSVRFQAKHPL